MCGFVGFYDVQDKYKFDMDQTLKKLYHRGPDAQNSIKIGSNMYLGFARLAIIDLSSDGEQPMSSEDGSITILFNGELYNYRELREELVSLGYTFRSNSDTEVFLSMYQAYGMDMLDQLEGMYSAAIIDQRKDEVYLLRDPFGIKPLYFSNSNGALAFGSEIKALLNCPNVSREIAADAIAEFLQYEYIQAPNTIFQDIKKLQPGHYLKVCHSELYDYEYWDCRESKQTTHHLSQTKERVVKELKDSLNLHLRSDVPIGLFLSGGIDSGLLVALASELVPSVDTYTLKFENGDFDESHLAQMVADRFHTNHHCYKVSPQDMKSLLPEMIWFCDEPLGDSGILPNYVINRLVAKDGIKVVLSGAGGDELFAGYHYYFGSGKERMVSNHPVLAKMVQNLLRGIKPNLSEKIEHALLIKEHPELHMFKSEEAFHLQQIQSIMSRKVQGSKTKQEYFERFRGDRLNALLYVDLKTYLADDLMLLADRSTMAHSVEGRFPFLYKPLVEYAFRIPEQIKAPSGQRKWLLREIAKEYLPEEVINAPKMGFCSPILRWADGAFGDYVYSVLNSKRSVERPFWNQSNYKNFVANPQNYKNNFSKIYLLLVLELFFRVHVDEMFHSIEELDLERIYGG